MVLIRGLPDDLARECLIRVPLESYRCAIWVSKGWKRAILDPEFLTRRRQSGHARPAFVVADAGYFSRGDDVEMRVNLILLSPESRSVVRLPPSPPFDVQLMKVVGIAAVGHQVVVLVATEVAHNRPSLKLVYIYDLLTSRWRRRRGSPAASSPPQEYDGRRVHFVVAADPLRRQVLAITGIYDTETRLLFVFLYDMATMKWRQLPHPEGDSYLNCKSLFYAGKFHIFTGAKISEVGVDDGVHTHSQSLDPDTMRWGPLDEDPILQAIARDRTAMWNGEGELYKVDKTVTVLRGGSVDGEWREVATVPDSVGRVNCSMAWRDKMVVIASPNQASQSDGEEDFQIACMLDLKTCQWTQHLLPSKWWYMGCTMDL